MYKKRNNDQMFIQGMQGCFNIKKSVYFTILVTDKRKKHNISKDKGKSFDKIQHPVLIKFLAN